MNIIDLGVIPYNDAVDVQLERLEAVTNGSEENTLFLLEHPPVITLGRQGGKDYLHVGEEFLATQGITLAHTKRGGNITCHYPGQLVAYPIWKLEKRPGGMRSFFCDMEEAVIRTCAHFGVEAERRDGHPGVWVDGTRKICSTGIAVKRWVTYHGLSFNISTDLGPFKLITLCGIPDAEPTSLSIEAGREITVEEVKSVFREEFRKAFAHPAMA